MRYWSLRDFGAVDSPLLSGGVLQALVHIHACNTAAAAG